MKITIYELLGLIKDGKAPKKVLVDDSYYEYNYWGNDYIDVQMTSNYWLFKDYTFGSNGNRLNKEIEIIEEVEDKEYEDIQKIKNKRFTRNQKQIASKINELIDVVNEMRKVR